MRTDEIQFQVSMQPGDNYRIAASGDVTFLDNLENDDAYLNVFSQLNGDKRRIVDPHIFGSPSDQEMQLAASYVSDTLTTWRFMNVELDSMPSPLDPSAPGGNLNAISGFIVDIVQSGNGILQAITGSSINDGSPNLSSGTPYSGRFENGLLTLGNGTNTVAISALNGNGGDFFDFGAVSFAGLSVAATDNDFWGNETFDGTISDVTKSGNDFVWTLNVGAGVAPDWTDYVGGTLEVGGGQRVAIVSVNAALTQVTTTAMSIPFVADDDDDLTLLPRAYPQLQRDCVIAFEEALIEPILGPAQFNNVISTPFRPNILPSDIVTLQESQLDVFRSNSYWAAYILWVHQFHRG